MKFSIIIPVYQDEVRLRALLPTLQTYRAEGHEVVVIGAAGDDGLAPDLHPLLDYYGQTDRGRASQMNAGAAAARGDLFLFLHADSRLPDNGLELIANAIQWRNSCWGRFDVRLDAAEVTYRVIELAMNWRSHLTGVVTGDQALWVTRRVFENLGGYAEIPLMEDIELSKRLRRTGWPVRLRTPVIASARRWQQRGVISTILTMWRLRLLYVCGVDPLKLARIYYRK